MCSVGLGGGGVLNGAGSVLHGAGSVRGVLNVYNYVHQMGEKEEK